MPFKKGDNYNKHDPKKWKKAAELLRQGASLKVAGYLSGVGYQPLSHQIRRLNSRMDGYPDKVNSNPEFEELIQAAHAAYWEARFGWQITVPESEYREELRIHSDPNIIKSKFENMEEGNVT